MQGFSFHDIFGDISGETWGKPLNDPQKNSGMAMDGLLEPRMSKGPGNDFFTCPLRMSNDSFSTFPNLPRCTKKDDSSGEEVSC